MDNVFSLDADRGPENLEAWLEDPADNLFALSGIFRDVHDVVLKNEQIGGAFPRQPDHILVVVFDPAAHHFPVRQLDADRLLLLAQQFQVSGFFKRLVRWWSLPAPAGGSLRTCIERHNHILHGASALAISISRTIRTLTKKDRRWLSLYENSYSAVRAVLDELAFQKLKGDLHAEFHLARRAIVVHSRAGTDPQHVT
jgi:hypothetical protein